MEVTAACIQLCVNTFVLLSTQACLSHTFKKPVFPSVSPDRLQVFEYESFSVRCGENEQPTAWRVMRKLNKMSSANVSDGCSIPAPSCTIIHAFESHSGEYWCENEEGEKSRGLNISVAAGPVILNISAQPVEEGSDVTLGCFNKKTEKKEISDFYKDGIHLETFYYTDLTLSKVSKSNEGFYKCSISKEEESPESWLAVVKTIEEEEEEEEEEEGSNDGSNLPLILGLFTTFSLLFLVMGLILYSKHKGTVPDPKDPTYARVNKRRRTDGDSENEVNGVTYAAVDWKRTGPKVSTATSGQYSSQPEPVYSLITLQ